MSEFSEGYFCVHAESSGELKSFSAGSRNGQNTLKVEVSFGSAVELGYAIDQLAKLQASIKARRTQARTKRPRLLALPAPGAAQ